MRVLFENQSRNYACVAVRGEPDSQIIEVSVARGEEDAYVLLNPSQIPDLIDALNEALVTLAEGDNGI